MKNSERRHLKHNEVADLLANLADWFAVRGRTVTWTLVGVLALAAAIGGYALWRQHVTSKAQALLAEAGVVATTPVVPPASTLTNPTPLGAATFPSEKARNEAAVKKYLAAAEAYPSTQPGIAARYLAAAAYAELGRTEDARRLYQEVVDRDSRGLYGRMARLGITSLQVGAKQYDDAITTLREFAGRTDGDMPLDAVLMQLAQACQAAGRTVEARQAYTRVVDEFPQSLYAPEARERLQALRAIAKTS
jgi:predicted negative regulator of RcsB-dependent stress response